MLRNYLVVAFRNLRRDRVHSFINITGLAIGMAVAGLIGLWIKDECTYDRDNPHYHRIARLLQNQVLNDGMINTSQSIPYPLVNELRTTYAGDFKKVVAAWWTRDHVLGYGDKKLTQPGNFMDTGAIGLLGLHLLEGSPSALDATASIILSASLSRSLFGQDDPIGKTLHLDGTMTVAVRGVYADLPDNSTFKGIQFIAPFGLFVRSQPWVKDVQTDWGYDFVQIYVELADHADIAAVSARLRNSTLIHMRDIPLAAAYHPQVFVQPMSRFHLYNEFKNGVNTGGAIQFVWLFGTIGFFVLLLACINFMNLSTARSERRARETGIRKAIGGQRSQLILQFYSESIVVAFVAFLLGLGLVSLTLPWFNSLAGKHITIEWLNPWLWLTGVGFSFFTGLLAGSYPALYLSSFRPVAVLKGSFKAGPWAMAPRRALVVLQFGVSVLLVIGTAVVFQQIQYARNRPTGYDRDGLLAMVMTVPEFPERAETLRQELLRTGVVEQTAVSSSPTTQVWESYTGFEWPGKDPNLHADFITISASYDYGSTIGWQIREGRDFSRAFATDSSGVIINESAVAFMGLHHPIGTPVKWGDKSYRVVGVVRDMVVEAPYERTRPAVYLLNYDFNHYWHFIKLRPGIPVADALAKVSTAFQHVLPAASFDYHFVDEQYNRLFAAEQRSGTLAGCFASLALFISALGIFGMASFVAERRTREIGVRRVLGATVFSIWQLLSREFIGLVFLSLLISAPLAWMGMHHWLSRYTLHTDISWWTFVATAAGALAITILTVSWTAIRSALTNPVKSLRRE